MAQTDKEKWLEGAEEYGAPLEDWTKVPVISDESSIDDTMSVPGVQYSANPTITNNAKPQNFVQLHLATLFRKINNMLGTVTEALSDLGLIKTETIAAKDAANAATQAASQATAEAENVNAEITGMTVTITNRQGVSRSVDIGFDIYNVYGSVAAMNADAANVPKGKFVMIATEDPTSPENARLYGRNSNSASSAEPFTFLSDLDQASSSAWADWMENQKPTIERATLNANNAAALATNKAGVAQTAADNADASRQAIESNEETRQAQERSREAAEAARQSTFQTNETARQTTFNTNEAARQSTFDSNEQTRQTTFDNDEAQRQQDFEDAESERMAAMIVTHCFVDPVTMCLMFVTPQKDTTNYQVRNGDLNIIVTY